ncbi:MAG: hypothetical protein A3B96_00910 [Candidatus Spechtbacteria bacterium RIFCSPHIGHO2_02_FULL_43_15b]|nr:MAG: hypothetical protein A3B96_00910 [Candidatus Spechtbacteria bacterium RIFCSPHIGHO2_02_FULL_43_15b]
MNLLRIIQYGWAGFWRNFWVSSATMGIMVLALCVVSLLLVMGYITDAFIEDVQGKVDISVYFERDISENEVLDIKTKIDNLQEVRETEYISQEEALKVFRERHKTNDLLMASLQELDSNPFQASLNIKANEASQFDSIVSFIEKEDGLGVVAKINFKENEKVIERLISITSSIENMGVFVTFLLSFVAMLITFNTIRLVIYNQRDEISVMKLVGASDWFIRGPFVVTGSIYGITAGAITWAIFFVALWFISEKVGAVFPGTDVYKYWSGNLFGIFGLLVGFGVALGAVSSFVAVRRYLKT